MRPFRTSHLLMASVLAVSSAASPRPASAAPPERQDGQGAGADQEEIRAQAPDRPKEMPLASLPDPPSLEPPPPRPQAVEAMDRLLSEITDKDPRTREQAFRTLLEAKPDWVSSISRRIDEIRDKGNLKAQKELLTAARDRARDGLSKDDPTPDYLSILLNRPETESQDWKDVARLLALSRMLGALESTPAARELIRIYSRFGDFMRVDCQRQLDAMGDRSVAALLEATRHPAPQIAEWATKQLTLRKKLNPHQAVRTDDPRALSDVLVALGRLGDAQSTRLLISFAGTQQEQVRTAARQGIVLLAESATWQLRDAYQDTTGKTPPRDWTWKRIARELFTEFDRLRLQKVYALYEKALASAKAGEEEAALEGFDEVLTQDPDFPGTDEMWGGYHQFSQNEKHSLDARLLAAQRAERVAPSQAQKKKSTSVRLLLEAEILRERGIVDRTLLARAVENDESARQKAVSLLSTSETATWGRASRYLIAALVAGLSIAGAAFILLSGLRKSKNATPESSENTKGST